MNPSEIALVRAELAANPRASEIAQMRLDSDKRGLANPIAPDIAIEPTVVGGVQANGQRRRMRTVGDERAAAGSGAAELNAPEPSGNVRGRRHKGNDVPSQSR